jgi:hypothetical protein
MKSVSSRSERRRQVKILRQKIINGFNKLSQIPIALEDTGLSDYQFLVQAQKMFQAWENYQQEITSGLTLALEDASSEPGTQPILVTTAPLGHWFGSLWRQRQDRPADPPTSGLPPARPLNWP